ncbi:hypothetical protein GQR58_012306 [Nymphon striatum]|nr:hypothetical protein GQR58_012306 [Nymphon striatum]
MDILYPVRVLKGPEDVFKRQDGRHSHVTFIATACLRAEELGRYGFGRVVNLRTRHSGLGVTMRDIYIAHSMDSNGLVSVASLQDLDSFEQLWSGGNGNTSFCA